MLSNIKPISEKYAQKVVKRISFVHPNALTLLGSIPSLLFFVFVLLHWYILALFVFLFNVLDMLDGALARSTGRVSAFGGLLDSTLDRVADFFIISAFGFAHLVRWEIIAPVLLVSFLVSYVRSRGELASNGKISFSVGIVERPERLVIIFLAFVLYLFFPSSMVGGVSLLELLFLLLLFLSLVTIFQRIFFAYKKLLIRT